MKTFIINDTTKISKNGKFIQHFGCELVMETYREQLNRVGIELVGSVGREKNFKIPKEVDLVIVNGEGSIHNGQRSYMIDVANNYPTVLLNAVWQNNPPYPSLYKFKYITVRESLSYKQLPPNLPNAKIVPDLIYASSRLRKFQRLNPINDLGATDNATNKNAGFTIHCSADEYLFTISQYKRLCIGRFHALVAASVLGIPFTTWPSNTHKIQGILQDMKVPHLFFKTQEEALINTPSFFDEKISIYVEQTQKKINKMFENLHRLV